MLAVPMQAAINTHVETYEDDLGRPELDGEVECVKAAVAAPAENAGLAKLQPVVSLDDADALDLPIRPGFAGAVLADLQSFESRDAIIGFPPGKVAGVEDIRPRREPPGVVDCNDAGAPSAGGKVGVCG